MRKYYILATMVMLFIAGMIVPRGAFPAPYYEGKVITIIVGATPAGGYDKLARLLSKSLPKYIPGKPNIVIQNMPGAGGLIPANYLYTTPKPDGLTFGTFDRGLVLSQLMKGEGIRFDLRRFSWIGSAGIIPMLFAIRSELPYKSFDELNKSRNQIYVGATEVGTNTTQFPLLLKKLLKVNFKIVPGYPSSADIVLAIEKKEIDGIAASFSTLRPLIERGVVRPLIRGRISSPETEKLPVNEEMTSDPKAKTMMAILSSIDQLGRYYAAPPGTPSHILDILKEAFSKALVDPELKEIAQKVKLEADYISPQKLSRAIAFILNQPQDVVNEFTECIKF